jgi:plastocyanin
MSAARDETRIQEAMMNTDRRTVLLAGAAASLGLAAASTASAAETVKVRIPAAETAFKPEEVTIKVGDTVQWTNRSVVSHTVTCDPAKARDKSHVALPAGAAAFDSGELKQDTPWSQTFTVPGTYKYFCIEHEMMPMVATVIVTA